MAHPTVWHYENGVLRDMTGRQRLSDEKLAEKAQLEFNIKQLALSVKRDPVNGPDWPHEWFNGRENDLAELYELNKKWKEAVDNLRWHTEQPRFWRETHNMLEDSRTTLMDFWYNPDSLLFNIEKIRRYDLERFVFRAAWKSEISDHLGGVPFLAELIGAYWTEAIVVKEAPKEDEMES